VRARPRVAFASAQGATNFRRLEVVGQFDQTGLEGINDFTNPDRALLSNVIVVAGVSPAKLVIAADTAVSTVGRMIKDRPRRLDLIYVSQPLYFVTFTTRDRRAIPSLDDAQLALHRYGHCGIDKFNVALGCYVIMPDHVHLFVRGDGNFALSPWIGGLKRAMSVALKSPHRWQPGFFDHILRNDESYAEKWNYVRDNPVRAGLVKVADDWVYQGEIVVIDRA
jgi:putative transposase